MTKTTRTSSYLRNVTRQHEDNLPLLMPARTLTRLWRTMPPYERSTETTPPARYARAETGTSHVLQNSLSLHAEPKMDSQFVLPLPSLIYQGGGKRETTPPSSTQVAPFHASEALLASSPVTAERSTEVSAQVIRSSERAEPTSEPPSREQRPHVEARRIPAISPHRTTGESSSMVATDRPSLSTGDRYSSDELGGDEIAAAKDRRSLAPHAAPDRSTGILPDVKPARITLRPQSGQPQEGQEANATPLNKRRITDVAEQTSTARSRVPEPQPRSAVSPPVQEALPLSAIHIGTIDVHIVPPVAAVPLPPSPPHSPTVRSHSTPALSREMTSFIGLRQG